MEHSSATFRLEEPVRLHVEVAEAKLYAEAPGETAFADLGRELRRQDRVASDRARRHQGRVGAQTLPPDPVTVCAGEHLRLFHQLLFLFTSGRVEVIHAGQHVVQHGTALVDAVFRVPEGDGKIGRSEVSEEGQEQRGQRAFARAGPAEAENQEFGFAVNLMQEMIER